MTTSSKKKNLEKKEEQVTNNPISFDEVQKAKEEIKKIESELPVTLKDSWNKNYFQSPQLCDKNQNTLWLPDIGLTKDGDFKDYPSGWRLFLKPLDPNDVIAYQRYLTTQNRGYGGYGYLRNSNNDESKKHNGLVLYLTKINGDPNWDYIDPEDNVKKVMELPLSHFDVLRRSKVGPIDNWLTTANFIPFIEYSKAATADNHPTYAQLRFLANEILRGWRIINYNYKNMTMFHSKYFASLSEDLEKEKIAFQRKRASSLVKIAKLRLLLEAYNKGSTVEELTVSKKAARAERIENNAGIRLGVELERFTQLAVEVSRLKTIIEELENEMAKPVDKCKLDFSYFNRKIDKIEMGRGFLRDFLPSDKKQ